MDITTRKAILLKFKLIESQGVVEAWKVNDIDIWPIVKEALFFGVLKTSDKLAHLKLYVRTLQQALKIKRKSNLINLNKKDFLFLGYNANRITKDQYSYNKYFDPMMDYIESIGNESILVEFNASNTYKYYKSERVLLGENYIKKSSRNIKSSELLKLDGFNEFISMFSKEFLLNKSLILKAICLKINTTLMWEDFYLYLLKTLEPKMVFMLCYYCEPCFGLISAAAKLKIPTIDMQHGGQGELHFAYNYTPSLQGLNLLPTYFWVWDRNSYDNLKNWLKEDRILLGGNPSLVGSTSNFKTLFPKGSIFILYTLQTTIKPFIPKFLIDAVKKSPSNYVWLFRLHPRMKTSERSEIFELLDKENIRDRINFKEANDFSLSEILSETDVHLSAFSGSLIEANIVGVPLNVTFHEIGKKNNEKLVKNGELLFYDVNDVTSDFHDLIEEKILLSDDSEKKLDTNGDFFEYFTYFVNKHHS